jgi:hypothetical protein
MADKNKIRISLDLSRPAFDRLSVLEQTTEATSKADLIRDALRLYEYLVRQSLKGARVQCVMPTGETIEVFATSFPTPTDVDAVHA